jgi:16S rRNA (guanine966-N2)-methyltransferase
VCPGRHSYGCAVRVIGGRSRGRRLTARLPVSVRPTGDRVREAVFDILGSMGGVEDLHVLDLFCGSGAYGVEALSRGAASATFVDSDSAALDAVRANLTAVGLAAEPSTLVRADVTTWLERTSQFDLAFCDPPYVFGDWDRLFALLRADVGVLESKDPISVPAGWQLARARRYGGTLVTVVRQSPSPSAVRS